VSITLFGLSNCHGCKNAKDYLEKNNIQYEYVDIKDYGLEKFKAETNSFAAPTLKADGYIIVGFKKEDYDKFFCK
jgi:arsenate reductase-like glutaredoxin family protein